MASEFYGYFDSTPTDERDYNENDLSRGFRIMCDTGVATLDNDNLKVVPADSGLRTRVGYGGALVYGFPYELYDDGGAPMLLDHTLVLSYPRIDRVVLRLDLASEARHISLAVVEGAESATPVPPELTRSGTVYEISLAQCRVNPGATLFQAADITDERPDTEVCGAIRHAMTTDNVITPDGKSLQDVLQEIDDALIAEGNKTSADIDRPAASGQTPESIEDCLVRLLGGNIRIAELWKGTWSSGSITVPNLPHYNMVILYSAFFPVVCFRIGGYFMGFGSFPNPANLGITDSAVLAAASGETLTLSRYPVVTISTSGNVNGTFAATNVYGVDIGYGG